jgi:hypothetical protein
MAIRGKAMTIFGYSLRRALRLGFTISVLAITGCTSDDCSPSSPPELIAQDAALRAEIAQSGLPTVPALGDVLIIGGGISPKANVGQTTVAVEYFSASKHKFFSTGSLRTSRIGVVPVVVAKGALAKQVLVVGGGSGKATASASNDITYAAADLLTTESYNFSTGTFRALPYKLTGQRSFYTATALKDGTILIAGGLSTAKAPRPDAEIFDPVTNKFTRYHMKSARAFHSATLLPDGTVLLAGGVIDYYGDTSNTAEIYDPATHSFVLTKGKVPANTTFAGQTATLIAGCKCANDGKVLLAGGFNGYSFFSSATVSSTNLMLLYDPKTQTFSNKIVQMTDYRAGHTATLLRNGEILLAGGVNGQAETGSTVFGVYGDFLDSAEIFNPVTGKTVCIRGAVGPKNNRVCAPSMVNGRTGHVAALIGTGTLAGQVLLAGGIGGTKEEINTAVKVLTTAELYNPTTGKFAATASMVSPQVGAAAIVR